MLWLKVEWWWWWLCYVMWNLFNVGSLQLCNDRTITLLEANQNQPNVKYDINK